MSDFEITLPGEALEGETGQLGTELAEPVNFWDVPFEEYTVTEGYAFLIFLVLVLSALFKFVGGCFNA